MHTHKRSLGLVLLATFASPQIMAQENYPEIYPFVAKTTQEIHQRVVNISEDKNFEKNIFAISRQRLNSGKSDQQPWTSTYWPLNQGLIANPYQEALQILRPLYETTWQRNHMHLTTRAEKLHPRILKLRQRDLDRLAPSEKYDLLLGDSSFDLTNRLRDYMQKWGSNKELSFLSKLDKVGGNTPARAEQLVGWGQFPDVNSAMKEAIRMDGGLAEHFAQKMVEQGQYASIMEALPSAIEKARSEQDNYVLKDKNSLMALWEGICHGWATASMIMPRPEKTVTFELPNKKKLRFFPSDIKALMSLLWANSLIQDGKFVWTDNEGNERVSGGVIIEGQRCNNKNAPKDEWGRYYDEVPDLYSQKLEPRCVGVHPAIWHLSLVNIIGKQGRSFVVERKVTEEVDNHPMAGYSTEFFNPNTGEYASLENSLIPIDASDQFYRFRNPEARYIVGVKNTISYTAWATPTRKKTDSPKDDKMDTSTMLYDLELDTDGNIVGGQWRTTEVGKNFLNLGANHRQPDFFWAITKRWKETGYFNDFDLPEWTDTRQAPPSEWLEAAQTEAHAFEYHQSRKFGGIDKCDVQHKETKELVRVPCEFKTNRPQPLINLVNKLLELSRK